MSWISKLHETYEAAQALPLSSEEKPLPQGHIIRNAHINIVIDGKGNFKRAKVLDKIQVLLPSTEASAGRSGKKVAPHPLGDKLQYVALDCVQFGKVESSFFQEYEKLLREWCDSPCAHSKVQAVLEYVQKGTVIKDLTEHGITWCSPKGLLVTTTNELLPGDVPLALLLKTLPKTNKKCDQSGALVCWTVEIPGDLQAETWRDETIQKSWNDYLATQETAISLCNVLGTESTAMQNHPKGLRHSGDGAKLISSNDSGGFTYRGRFTEAVQAASVSREVSQKAHNALSWLIKRQGFRNDDQAVVAWAVSCQEIPSPCREISEYDMDNYDDASDVIQEDFQEADIDLACDLGASYAEKLKRYMQGYRAKLEPQESVVIMAIDSASPGRMAITYYREYGAHEYIDRISQWHNDFAWFQRAVSKDQGKKVFWDMSSPSLYNIMKTAYGDTLKSNEKLKKFAYERLLPCVSDGWNIPFDMVVSCFHRACAPLKGEHWEWELSLGVACALLKGFYARHESVEKRRRFVVGLDVDNCSRDYLYGRLLAMAERIEGFALTRAGESRPTTAERLMQRFAERPYSTWRTIELSLQPYLQRLQRSNGGFVTNRRRELDGIMEQFQGKNFIDDKPLEGEFLLGFHSQRLELRKKKEAETEAENIASQGS